ncbi:MAG: exopolysaccharide biosynthesis protein [Devosia sp.]
MDDHAHRSPIEAQVAAIAARIAREAEAEGGRLALGSLVTLLGARAHMLVILVLSGLNMIPGPPGYGGTIGFAIIAVAIAMLIDRPLRVSGWIGRRRISSSFVARMFERLTFVARLIGRFSRPRIGLLAGEGARRFLALFIIAVSLPMVLPIPFINAVPNVGIAVICVSRINRDGLGVVIGMAIACLGLALAGGAIWGVLHLVQMLMAG